MKRDATRPQLRSLQALRALAALLVVLFHVEFIVGERLGATPFDDAFSYGLRGVDLFFVLSGTIILGVHRADIGRPERFPRYAWNRLTRVYPAVWLMSGLALATYAAGFGGADKAAKLDAGSVLASLLLLPQPGPPLVNVTWTLCYEMAFYLLFGLAILHRRLGLFVLAAWQAAVAVVWAAGVGESLPFAVGIYLQPFCLEFGLGMACAVLIERLARPNPSAAATAAAWCVTALGVGLFGAGLVPLLAPLWSGVFCAVGSAAAIGGLVLLEQAERLRVPAALAALGDASYSIYLVHYSAITAAAVVLDRLGFLTGSGATLLALAGFGVFCGLAFDRLADRPIRHVLKPSAPDGHRARPASRAEGLSRRMG